MVAISVVQNHKNDFPWEINFNFMQIVLYPQQKLSIQSMQQVTQGP